MKLLTQIIKVVQFQSVTQVKDYPSKFKLISSWLNLRNKTYSLDTIAELKEYSFPNFSMANSIHVCYQNDS